jgi:hypothetical protein
MPTDKEAPRWPRGLRWLLGRSNSTPRSTGARATHPQNQLSGVRLGAAKRWTQ